MAQQIKNRNSKQESHLSMLDLANLLQLSPEVVKKDIAGSPEQLAPSHIRQVLANRGFSFKQRTISFQMLKGGVAKTTTCLNVGLRAAMFGARVLFIDMDQQANLSFALGVDAEELPVWIDLVEQKASIEELVHSVSSHIDIIPSNLDNSVLDRTLVNAQRNLSTAVARPLALIKQNYDLILIDTAPNLSAINTAVTCASDEIVLPINPDKFSMQGIKKHLEDLAVIREEFDLNFKEKILFTRFDARETLSHELRRRAVELYADRLMQSQVRTCAEIKNAIGGARQSIFSTRSVAKTDYDAVTRELLGWEFSRELN